MIVRFEFLVRAFEDGAHAYDQNLRFELGELTQPVETSTRMTDSFARGYHQIANPTPADINNVMCNELFHLLRQQAAPDEKRTLFVSGCLIRLCALPDMAGQFQGLARNPVDSEKLMLTIRRQNLPGGKARHSAVVVPVESPPLVN